MKNKIFGLAALMTLTSLSAFGVVRPGGERPVKTAQLEQIEGDGRYPRPTQLTMNKRDGAFQATSFTLVEDTGIRCITAPCPSSKSTQFKVDSVLGYRNGSVLYRASATVPPVMGMALPGHPIGGLMPRLRKIEVTDHSNNILARHKYQWVLNFMNSLGAHQYGGNPEPEPVSTIQGVNP